MLVFVSQKVLIHGHPGRNFWTNLLDRTSRNDQKCFCLDAFFVSFLDGNWWSSKDGHIYINCLKVRPLRPLWKEAKLFLARGSLSLPPLDDKMEYAQCQTTWYIMIGLCFARSQQLFPILIRNIIIIGLIKSQSDQHYYLSPTDFPCIQISLTFNQAVFPMSEYTEKPMHFEAWKCYTKKYKKTSNLVYLVIRRIYLIFWIVLLVA